MRVVFPRRPELARLREEAWNFSSSRSGQGSIEHHRFEPTELHRAQFDKEAFIKAIQINVILPFSLQGVEERNVIYRALSPLIPPFAL